MSDDIDAIICKDREDAAHIRVAADKQYIKQHKSMHLKHRPQDYPSILEGPVGSLRSTSSSGVGNYGYPSGVPRRTAAERQLLNQLSFSSQLSMEGRELCMNRRGASTCEREDVEDDVMMQRSESVLLPDDAADDMDRRYEARLPSD
jgi:hypothetical protein